MLCADRDRRDIHAMPIPKNGSWRMSASLAICGALALLLGTLVYLADRGGLHRALIPAAAVLSSGPVFGALGQWLPSFAHPFAFSLFTAAARPSIAPPAYGACLGWWVVNVVFEVGQHPRVSAPLAETLQQVLGGGRAADALSNYFLRGTFDVGDIAAATVGAMAAAGVLMFFHRIGRRK